MKIYKITGASEYLGVSINTLKTLANNGKIKSFKTTGEHRRFRREDLDAYMGVGYDTGDFRGNWPPSDEVIRLIAELAIEASYEGQSDSTANNDSC